MTIRRIVLSAFLSVLIAPAIFAHGTMKFTVDLLHTVSHEVHVTMVPTGFHSKIAFYQMPIWAPGAYSVTGYGRYVRNFRALNKYDHDLKVIQIDSNRWEIPTGQSVKKIVYDVLDSHKDTTSLYFAMANIDSSLFFANATALFGYFNDDKSANATVTYELPEDWKLACPLTPGPQLLHVVGAPRAPSFSATDYDVLADAPILAAPNDTTSLPTHDDRVMVGSFTERGASYDVAFATNGRWSKNDMDSLMFYLGEIAHAETDFFHDTPFKHYTFEIFAPTFMHMPSMAQGALEHANSSDYLLMDMSWPTFKRSFLPIFSHEFFHLWNVKRIHSKLLGPFDYTKRVMTKSLWLAEGVTEYYAHTLLSRYGIIPQQRLFDDIAEWRREMAMSPDSAKQKSLEQLSIDESDFNLDEATLFYSRGPLVALMLDIEIRSRTNNQKSLDDVMLALNKDAQEGKTFDETHLIDLIEKYSGIDLTDFYDRYVHGTDSLPVDSYLAKMGVNPSGKHKSVIFGYANGEFIITSLDSSSDFAHAGIKVGDALTAVNGTKITLDNVDQLASLKDSVKSATFSVDRDGQILTVPVTFTDADASVASKSSKLQLEIRKGITGK